MNFFSLRPRWPLVLGVGATLVVLVLIVFRYQYVMSSSGVYRIDTLTGHFCQYPCTPEPFPPTPVTASTPTPAPTTFSEYLANQPVDEQLGYAREQRFLALLALAPPANMANFGQQMTAASFHADNLIGQGFETSSRALYVVYSHCASEGTGCEHYHLGILDGDTLQEIWLPHALSSGLQSEYWQYMEVLSSSEGDTVVVRGQNSDGTTHQYSVSSSAITEVKPSTSGDLALPVLRTLGDGASCQIDNARDSPTFVWAMVAQGRKSALVTKNDFLAMTNKTIRLKDVDVLYCTHFQDVDMLVVGSSGMYVTIVLKNGSLRLASPGNPIIITSHHLLLATTEVDSQGMVVPMWDYVHVRPKKSL